MVRRRADRGHPRDRRRGPRAGQRRSARPASRTPTARPSWPSSRPPAASRASSASPPTASTTSRPGCAPGSSRPTRSSSPAASRSGPTTSSARLRGVRHDRPVAGRRPARQAVRVRHGARAGDDGATRTVRPALLFGLPGNPVSTFVTFELFVRPALRRLAGHRDATCSARRPGRPPRRGRARARAGGRSCACASERDAAGSPVRDERGRVRASAWPAARRGRGATSCRRSRPPTPWRSSPRRTTPTPAGARSTLVAGPRLTASGQPLSSDAMDPKAEPDPDRRRAPSAAV